MPTKVACWVSRFHSVSEYHTTAISGPTKKMRKPASVGLMNSHASIASRILSVSHGAPSSLAAAVAGVVVTDFSMEQQGNRT
ncbi:MAG: hypothetical protein K0S21_3602 [Rhizobiaceae bacterium]|nr:hypothetical protein [Rhizobiaceae bacterium]